MTGAGVAGIALWAPGLENWAVSRPVLRGEAPHIWRDAPPPPPNTLAANERRRSSAAVRLALGVAAEAVTMAGVPAGTLRGVFASGNGDGAVVCGILEALAAGQDVSPTAFHNSVHNAAAGYFAIGERSTQPITCVAAHDDSFAAGLLTAMAMIRAEAAPVLLVAYDAPVPPPLAAKRPTIAACAMACVLVPEPDAASGWLDVEYRAGICPVPLPADPALHALALGNPAGRALALLQAVARAEAGSIVLPFGVSSLHIRYRPCSTAPASSN